MMHGHRKSDSSIEPAKPPNRAEPEAKEAVEERGLAKGNLLECNMFRTQSRQGMPSALERIRHARTRDRSKVVLPFSISRVP
jgi:RNA-directed DNA polymerase